MPYRLATELKIFQTFSKKCFKLSSSFIDLASFLFFTELVQQAMFEKCA